MSVNVFSKIKIRAMNEQLSASASEEIVAGTMGVVTFQAVFSPVWSGMTKTLVFEGSGVSRAILYPGGEMILPRELIARPGQLHITAVGVIAGKRAITAMMRMPLEIVPGGTSTGEEPWDTTPELWEQMMSAVGDLSQLSTETRDNLVAAINEVLANSEGSGSAGADGGYYTPSVTQQAQGMTISYAASKAEMPPVAPVTVQLPQGDNFLHVTIVDSPSDAEQGIADYTHQEVLEAFQAGRECIASYSWGALRLSFVSESQIFWSGMYWTSDAWLMGLGIRQVGTNCQITKIKMPGTGYTLPTAAADTLGGIKADAAQDADTQPARIGEDGKLYTRNTAPLIVSTTGTDSEAGEYIVDKTVEEVEAAMASGRECILFWDSGIFRPAMIDYDQTNGDTITWSALSHSGQASVFNAFLFQRGDRCTFRVLGGSGNAPADGMFLVTITIDAQDSSIGTADKGVTEVIEAFQAGKTCVATVFGSVGNHLYQAVYISSQDHPAPYIHWSAPSVEDVANYGYTIVQNGVNCFFGEYINLAPFVVTTTDNGVNTFTASHSASDIFYRMKDGATCYLMYGDSVIFTPAEVSQDVIIWNHMLVSDHDDLTSRGRFYRFRQEGTTLTWMEDIRIPGIEATSDYPGGVLADPKQDTDTQPVRIGEDGKLYTAPGGGSYTLPVAAPTTLGGVKPVSKTADMTQPVGVNPDGTMWTAPVQAGGSGGWNELGVAYVKGPLMYESEMIIPGDNAPFSVAEITDDSIDPDVGADMIVPGQLYVVAFDGVETVRSCDKRGSIGNGYITDASLNDTGEDFEVFQANTNVLVAVSTSFATNFKIYAATVTKRLDPAFILGGVLGPNQEIYNISHADSDAQQMDGAFTSAAVPVT